MLISDSVVMILHIWHLGFSHFLLPVDLAEATRLDNRPPCRPIVSCIGTIAEHISGFEDSILQPLLQKIQLFVRYYSFSMKSLSSYRHNCSWVHVELDGCKFSLHRHSSCKRSGSLSNKHNMQTDIATDIPILIDFILRHNTLTFNDKCYL